METLSLTPFQTVRTATKSDMQVLLITGLSQSESISCLIHAFMFAEKKQM